jgi:demethylmenaquinone methyltransferase/2-methoxy-6-polyprenyl-1,4-benzoquinol methylase
MCRYLPQQKELKALDCATGTCDQIIALFEQSKQVKEVVGIDLAEEMIAIGQQKLIGKSYSDRVTLKVASALEIPYPDNTFDCITISFGIRNVTDVVACLKEFLRVLKPKGRVLILEGSIPSNPLLKAIHLFYLRHFLPRIGGVISKQKSAYRYLNETIETFPCGENFLKLMKKAGFAHTTAHPITGGIVTIYQGDKKDAHVSST